MRVIQVTSSACCVVTDDSSSSSLSPPHPSLRCDRHPSLRCICEGGVALSRIPKHAEDLVTDRRQKRVFCNDSGDCRASLPPSLPTSLSSAGARPRHDPHLARLGVRCESALRCASLLTGHQGIERAGVVC
jgi:hypothetical protein